MIDIEGIRLPLWVRLVLGFLLGVAAWIAVLPLIPDVQRDLGPARVTAHIRMGRGETRLITPPVGSISANTHSSPLDIRLLLAEIDVVELEDIFKDDPTLARLAVEMGAELRNLGQRLFLQVLIAGLLAGAVAGALLPRRDPTTIAAAAVGGLLAGVVTMSLVTITFEQDAFEEPRFTGALRRAPQVIRAVDRGLDSLGRLGSRYEDLSRRFLQVLALSAHPELELEENAVAILHVSDIHSNPLGIQFVRRLARAFDVDAVVDTGDLTSFGHPQEARLGDLIEEIEVPYIFIPGNHDSTANRLGIDRLPGVTMLEDTTEEVRGFSILGWADPTFTADNQTSTEEGNERRLEEADEVLSAVLAQGPDILAVHDVRLASESFGAVEIILAGHTHERQVEMSEGSLVLTVGSAGATGLGSLLVESDIPYEAQILYLQPDKNLIVDYVSLSAFGREFDVERRVYQL